MRWPLGLCLVGLAAASLLGGTPGLAAGPVKRAPEPPDVVILIVADALRADYLSCYAPRPVGLQRPAQPTVGAGCPADEDDPGNQTPHIDALARDGVLYRRMSAQASWTKPSVATMLTSLYPSSHRAIREQDLLPDEAVTLPEVLREHGYRTAGLTTNIFTSPQFNFQQGYDEYEFFESTYPFLATRGYAEYGLFAAPRCLQAAVTELAQFPAPRRYHDAASLNHQALTWLEANKDTRFFLYLHYMDPHQPYYAHPYDGGPGVVAQNSPASRAPLLQSLYRGEVMYLDEQLGLLFQALRRWDLYDDALIVFTADHGEEFYEHGNWGHGRTLYEEQLHVPLIVKYPGNARAGSVDVALARSLDIAPTILDVIGVPVPEATRSVPGMQGVSLRPGATAPRAEVVFAEQDRQGNVIRAIRTRRYKLIIANAGNPRGLPVEALFDLQADPAEQRNLVADEPATVRTLRTDLEQAIAAHRALCVAEGRAVAGQSRELDAATRERLRELGY